jgi:flagella basal body P-ring formation protein FlgA
MKPRALPTVLLLALACCASAPYARAGAVTAQLRGEAVVAGETFALGEIAGVSGAELAGLAIGRSPRAGSALTVRRADVERAIARLKPGTAVRVTGAERVVVRRGPVETVAAGALEEAALQAVRRYLAERFARFDVLPPRERAADLAVPPGRRELRARVAAAPGVPERVAAWVDVLVDGRRYQSVPVRFAVRAYQPVLAARVALASGASPAPEAFEIVEAQVAGAADAPVAPDADVRGLRLTRALAAGEILTWAHAARAPAVRRNEAVRVRAAAGRVAVEDLAFALEDARPGQIVRLRSPRSGEIYAGRVTAAGLVEATLR